MKKSLSLLALLFAVLLTGCGEEPPYKLSYKFVKNPNYKIQKHKWDIDANFYVESTDGESVLYSCDGVLYDREDKVERGVGEGSCQARDEDGNVTVMENVNIKLSPGKPVNINYVSDLETYEPLSFTIVTDKGKFNLPLSRKEKLEFAERYKEEKRARSKEIEKGINALVPRE